VKTHTTLPDNKLLHNNPW